MRYRLVGLLLGLVMVLSAGPAATQTGFFPNPDNLQVGLASMGPTPMKLLKSITVSVTGASVATVVCAEQTKTVTGILAGDFVAGFIPTATGNSVGIGVVRVSADNTVAITYCNPTAGALTPATGNWTFFIVRPGP